MITGFHHIALAVNGLAAAREAYARFFGRPPADAGDLGRADAWFHLETLSLRLMEGEAAGAIGQGEEAQGDGIAYVAFKVDDLDAAGRRLERRGLRTQPGGPEGPGLVIHRRDAGGIALALSADRLGPASLLEGEGEGGVLGLDHLVVTTAEPERALGLYGAKLGLDLRLDRTNPAWGVRQQFFRCGRAVLETVCPMNSDDPPPEDRLSGLAWRVGSAKEAHGRLTQAGFSLSEVRAGRKPGTQVFTLRDGLPAAPCLLIEQGRPVDGTGSED